MSAATATLPANGRRRLLLIDPDAPLLRVVEHTIDVDAFDIDRVPSPWVSAREMEPERFALVLVNRAARESSVSDGFCEGLRAAARCPLIVVTRGTSGGAERPGDAHGAPPLIRVRGGAELRSALRTILGSSAPRPRVLRAGPLRLDPQERAVTLDGEPLPLSPEEFAVCSLLIEHEGMGIPSEELVALACAVADGTGAAFLDACIERMRKLLTGSSARILDRSGKEFLLTVVPRY